MIDTRASCLQILAVLLLCSIQIGCVESSFELADKSRVPSWLPPPSGMERGDVGVTLDYHTDGSAVFKLYNKENHRLIGEVTGVMRDETPLEKDGTSWPTGTMPNYPLYVVVIFQGKAQIIEHKKMEPLFYISDDKSIVEVLGCTEDMQGLYVCRE